MRVSNAQSCLGNDEACSLPPLLAFGSDETRPGTIALHVGLTLPTGMSGTFRCRRRWSASASTYSGINATPNPSFTGLRPESGTIVVESSTIAGYVVTFDMVLATTAGQRISRPSHLVELN